VLNLTEDHLDWHGSMAAYGEAKASLLRMARESVVNRDDAGVVAMVSRLDDLHVRSFGASVPVLAGDLGLDTHHGMAWLAASEPAGFEEPAPARRKKGDPPPARAQGRFNRLMPADALRIRGRHNALNAQAALLLARSLSLPWAPLLRALSEYTGEPHRMEFIRAVCGVDFIDDSKGTNVGATVAALDGMDQRVVLIAGGDGKGQDFSPLRRPVASQARAVVLIGRDGPAIAQAIVNSDVPTVMCASLPEAVEQAFALAREGDAVLLSPACASLDMFRNYAHRSAVFVDAVVELALQKGEVGA
jgi:UDP-N-acetylmuramoylalanine--D-glutamate ligase